MLFYRELSLVTTMRLKTVHDKNATASEVWDGMLQPASTNKPMQEQYETLALNPNRQFVAYDGLTNGSFARNINATRARAPFTLSFDFFSFYFSLQRNGLDGWRTLMMFYSFGIVKCIVGCVQFAL